MIPEQLPGSNSSSLNPVVMSAARGYSPFPMPHIHRELHGSALAAARGRLYMFGGWSAAAALTRSELEVYDPHIDSWFSTGAMLPGKGQLQGKQQERQIQCVCFCAFASLLMPYSERPTGTCMARCATFL